jgi:hypothetical protein
MKRFLTHIVAASAALFFAALTDVSLYGQGAGGGGGTPGSGTAGGTAQGAGTVGGAAQGAGTAAVGQSGAAAQLGTGQTGAAGQMGTGQTGAAGQVGSGRRAGGQFDAPVVPRGIPRPVELYGPTPWFADPAVQQQLRLNPNQFNQLNQAYQSAFNQYQRQLSAFDNTTGANVNVGATTGQTGAAGTGSTATRSSTARSRTAARPTTGDSTPSGTGATQTGAAGQMGTGQTGAAGQMGTGQTGAAGTARTSTGTNSTGTGTVGTSSRVGFNADGTTMTGGTLTDEQRQALLLQAQRNFDSSFNQSLGSVLTDPAQRARFGQLHTQFRGFDAFLDPTIRQNLNLTNEQLQRLTQFRTEWFNQLQNFRDALPADRQEALRRWNILRAQFGDQVNQVLTPAQQQLWMQLYGEPFPFDFSVFFGTDPLMPAGRQDPLPDTRRSASESAAAGTSGSTIGTSANPTPGSGIGTSTTPTPGSSVGTGTGTSAGAGTGTGTGTSRTDRK